MVDILPNTSEIAYLNAEPAIRELKTALTEQRPINIASPITTGRLFLGDAIIHACGINKVLETYSVQNNLPQPDYIYDPNSMNDFRNPNVLSMNHTLTSLDMLPVSSRRAYLDKTERLANALRIQYPDSPLSPLFQIPNHPWLNNFSRETTESIRNNVIHENGHNIVAIVQTGSSPIKRWDANHVIQVQESGKPYFERADFNPIILSDAKLKKDSENIKLLSQYGKDHDIPVYFYESVEELAGYTGAASLLLSTDSAPDWVWEAERPDSLHNAAFVHHTVTSNFWLIPRGTGYFSEAVRKNPKLKNGFIESESVYTKHYNLSNPTGPAQQDVNDYCAALGPFLKEKLG